MKFQRPLLDTSAALSPYTDDWAISATSVESYVAEGMRIHRIPKAYKQFAYLDEKRLLGIRSDNAGTALDVLEHGQEVKSYKFEHDYEDIVIEWQLQRIILVGAKDLMTLDSADLDKQKTIPLPNVLGDKPYRNLELFRVPNSNEFLLSVNEFILKVSYPDGAVSVFSNPSQCWITRMDVTANGHTIFLDYQNPSLSGKKCSRLHRIEWPESGPVVQDLQLGVDEDSITSFLLARVNDKEFLISSRKDMLEAWDMDRELATQTSLWLDKNLGTAVLQKHPYQNDRFYVLSLQSISQVVLKQQAPWFVPSALISTESTIPHPSQWQTRFLKASARDFSKILLLYENALHFKTFLTAGDNLLEIGLSCSDKGCRSSPDRRYAIHQDDERHLQWVDHVNQRQMKREFDFALLQSEALNDGTVILVSATKDIYVWTPDSDVLQAIGPVDLEGDVTVQSYPLAGIVTISTPQVDTWGLLTTAAMPKTVMLIKRGGSWSITNKSFPGLPLPISTLPLVLFATLNDEALEFAAVNASGQILHNYRGLSFAEFSTVLNESFAASNPGHLKAILEYALKHVQVLGHEPYLYSSCRGVLTQYDIYRGLEMPPPMSIPSRYRASSFLWEDWLAVEDLEDASQRYNSVMNIRTGHILKLNSDAYHKLLFNIGILGGHWDNQEEEFRDKWGQTFLMDYQDARSLFATPDEFVAGFSTGHIRSKKQSSVRIDPDWMDRQLRKSSLHAITGEAF
ncbi:MAG TPA: hypothetical protein VE954_40260 [Oligoflexus sp.]|nr:hypothetical protein [Oligoflexus sp.]